MECVHLSQLIDVPASVVYAYAHDLRHLPEWAAGLGTSVVQEDGAWVAQSPMGPVVVELVPDNDLGVLDHVVVLPDGERVYNPMRVIPWDDRSEVVFSLRRRPGTTDEEFAGDADAVRADLLTLKALLERRARGG